MTDKNSNGDIVDLDKITFPPLSKPISLIGLFPYTVESTADDGDIFTEDCPGCLIERGLRK